MSGHADLSAGYDTPRWNVWSREMESESSTSAEEEDEEENEEHEDTTNVDRTRTGGRLGKRRSVEVLMIVCWSTRRLIVQQTFFLNIFLLIHLFST